MKNVLFSVLATACVASSAAAQALEVRIEPPGPRTLEKVGISFPADCGPIDGMDDRKYRVTAEITTPSGQKHAVPGFYFQPCEYRLLGEGKRKTEWIYPAGPARWVVRYAPTEPGRHALGVQLESGVQTFTEAQTGPGYLSSLSRRRTLPGLGFDVRRGREGGYVRVSTRDARYLEFSDGRCFFPIGQNIAFMGGSQYVGTAEAAREMFAKMASQGGNYVRLWACCEDWAMAIEARKSAWGRSWGPKPPIVPMPSPPSGHLAQNCVQLAARQGGIAVQPTRPIALRPGSRYRLSGLLLADEGASVTLQLGSQADLPLKAQPGKWTPFSREFVAEARQLFLGRLGFTVKGGGSAYLADLSLVEVAQPAGGDATAAAPAAAIGPERLWQADVNRPVIGWYDQEDCFLMDRILQAAEETGIYLQLVVVTRDLYMKSLSKEDSPEYEQAIADARRLLRYAVARWGYSPNIAVWEYFNEIDPGKPTGRFYREVGAYLHRIDIRRRPRATSDWAPCPRDWNHPQLDTADMHFYLRPSLGPAHQDAAATVAAQAAFLRAKSAAKPALLSEFGLADDKWQRGQFIDQDKAFEHQHAALWASTMSGLAGASMYWWWDNLDKADAYRHYRPLADFVADIPFTTAGLAPAEVTCSPEPKVRALALAGKDQAYVWVNDPRTTWHALVVEKLQPREVRGASVELAGLAPGRYVVAWWDTWAGKEISRQEAEAAAAGLKLAVPPFTKDVACKIRRK